MTKQRRHAQLSMNAGTAFHRLRGDLLFAFIKAAGHRCYRCDGELTRDTYSIDHKEAWLDSDNPAELFFDPENIAYSHQACNYVARRVVRSGRTTEEKRIKHNQYNAKYRDKVREAKKIRKAAMA